MLKFLFRLTCRLRRGSVFLLGILLLLQGCGSEPVPEKKEIGSETTGYLLYSINEKGDQLVSEKYMPDQSDSSYLVDVFLKKAKQASKKNEPLLKKDIEIEGKSLEQGVLTLDFNAEFAEMETSRMLLARAGLTKLFTQLEGIDAVRIMIDGKPLRDSNGQEILASTKESFVENAGKSIHSYQNTEMTLYFTDQSGERLVREVKDVYYSSNEPIEKAVVEQIIKGPSENGHFPVVGSDTKVLSVAIQEGTCYVNFDDSFKSTAPSVKAEVQIYSIVNSLADTCHISKVKFSINGKSNVEFRGAIPLDKQYGKDDSLLDAGH